MVPQVECLKIQQPSLPRCEGMRSTIYARDSDEKHPDMRCCRNATYLIDGKYYCKPHAGDVALRMLIDQQ